MLSLVFFMASAKELKKCFFNFFPDRLLVTKYLKIQLKYHTSYADTTLVYSLSWVTTQGCLKAWPKNQKSLVCSKCLRSAVWNPQCCRNVIWLEAKRNGQETAKNKDSVCLSCAFWQCCHQAVARGSWGLVQSHLHHLIHLVSMLKEKEE